MAIFLLDPGLQGPSGHHMHMVLSVRDALRARGQVVRIIGHRGLSAAHAQACQAEPLFSVGTYQMLSNDPLCGPIETALAGGPALAADLQGMNPAEGDVLVWLTASPMQLLAASICHARWPARLLNVFVGALPIHGIESAVWRFAWRRLPAGGLKTMAATARIMGEDYAKALGHPVHLMPSTHQIPLRDRRGAAPVVIGVLGHQCPRKGIRMVEEVVRRTVSPVRWIVQDGGGDVPAIIDALANFPNVEVLRGPVGDWDGLLTRCDALLLPYDRADYARMHSGLVAEALAGGMPMVHPDTPALMAQSAAGGRIAYTGDGPEVVAAAVDGLVERFDELALVALDAAAPFRSQNGPGRWADWLVHHAAETLNGPTVG